MGKASDTFLNLCVDAFFFNSIFIAHTAVQMAILMKLGILYRARRAGFI